MEIIYDCNKCLHISLTESEQQRVGNHIPHLCNLLGVQLFHRGKHPELPPPKECMYCEKYHTLKR